jgi:hypothetical protein
LTTKEFYAEVARHADTDGTKINAADVSRVLAVAFRLIGEMPATDQFALMAKLAKTREAK